MCPGEKEAEMSHTFTGGIFPEYSRLDRATPVTSVDPDSITLKIPDGYALRVTDGERVLIGTVIADGDGAAVICGISGVASLSEKSVTVTNDRLGESCSSLHPMQNPISEMTADELRNELHRAGIPTPNFPSAKPVECVTVDCCEPDTDSLSVAATLFDRAEAVVGGLRIFMKLMGTAKGYLAVPRRMHVCADELSGHTDGRLVKIRSVSDKYPQHEPHMLISSLFNLEINSLTDTASAGYPVITAEVCAAAFDALAKGVPYTSSYVTVSGNGMLPQIYSVPFGSELVKLPSLCGCTADGEISVGGEMMHRTVSEGEYLQLGIRSVAVVDQPKKQAVHECTDCGRCAAVCPIRLLPPLIYRCDDAKMAKKFGAECCILCGCCNSVCPAGIDLRASVSEFARQIKKEVTA